MLAKKFIAEITLLHHYALASRPNVSGATFQNSYSVATNFTIQVMENSKK